jgi:hypothetical protein
MNEGYQILLSLAPSLHTSFIVISTVATTLTLSALARNYMNPVPEPVIRSPNTTLLPELSKEEYDELPYPPDAFPGARDVASPVSVITCELFRFGPEKRDLVALLCQVLFKFRSACILVFSIVWITSPQLRLPCERNWNDNACPFFQGRPGNEAIANSAMMNLLAVLVTKS